MSATSRSTPDETFAEGQNGLSGPDDALFRIAFHNSPAVNSIVRIPDSVIVEINDAFTKILGYSREDVLGKTPFDLQFWVTPEKLPVFRQMLETQGRVRNFEVDVRAKDGTIHTMLLSAQIVNIDGVPHSMSAGVDITARKAAEAELRKSNERLRQSEERFSKVFRASPALVVISRLSDGKFIAANEVFLRTTGYSETEVVGHTSAELNLLPSEIQREEFLKALRERGSVRDQEFIIRARNGQMRTLLVSAEMIDIDGAQHIQTVGLDISERKASEEKLHRNELRLRESEARVRSLYESISAAVAVHDETGFIQINSASLKLFGSAKAEDILGKQPAEFSAARQPDGEESAVAARRHMDKALATGVDRFEWMARRLDGTEFPVEVTLTAVHLEGRPALQAVIIDLTERKHAEAELQNALAKERELSQLKSDFVSLVSHEFRTPLEIIMSSADNLDRYHDRLPREKREQLLRTINRSVRRMSGMMEEVLVLGRLETDRMTFKPAAFDLPSFCQRVCDEIESAMGKRCPIHLQTGDATGVALGDENVLRHIFTNLLSNAVKYSEPGQSVELRVHRDNDDAVFQVIDHGCGIPGADQKRLFQAFHRGSNVRQIPGTGLGLLIVRRCVELHGGEIEFESIETKGTTFSVRLALFASA